MASKKKLRRKIERLEQHIENLEQVGKENEVALSNIVKVIVNDVGLDYAKSIISECEADKCDYIHFNMPPNVQLRDCDGNTQFKIWIDEPHPLDPPHKVCANCGLPKLAPFDGLCLNCSTSVYE